MKYSKEHISCQSIRIHVDPLYPVSLNYTCLYCPTCDLMIAQQDEVEHLLAALFEKNAPNAVGNEYLVLGTVDPVFWKQGTRAPHAVQGLVDNLPDFKLKLMFQTVYGWVEKRKSGCLDRNESRSNVCTQIVLR